MHHAIAMPAAWNRTAAVLLLSAAASLPAGLAAATSVTAGSRYFGACDGSAALALDDTHFINADDEGNVLRIFEFGEAKVLAASDETDFLKNRKPSGKAKEADLEGAARIGDRIYWIASNGRDGEGARRSLSLALLRHRRQRPGRGRHAQHRRA